MFVGTVEPEERSHANETSYSDTYTPSLEKREGGGGREEGIQEGERRMEREEREGKNEGEGGRQRIVTYINTLLP